MYDQRFQDLRKSSTEQVMIHNCDANSVSMELLKGTKRKRSDN